MAAIDYSELISLLPSIVTPIASGVLSFVGGYIAARKSAKAQILTTAQTSFVAAKLDVFQNFELAFKNWCISADRANYAEMYRCENAALLVANDDTCTCIAQFMDLIRNCEASYNRPSFEDISAAHANLIFAMRADLLTFPIPKPTGRQIFRQRKSQ